MRTEHPLTRTSEAHPRQRQDFFPLLQAHMPASGGCGVPDWISHPGNKREASAVIERNMCDVTYLGRADLKVANRVNLRRVDRIKTGSSEHLKIKFIEGFLPPLPVWEHSEGSLVWSYELESRQSSTLGRNDSVHLSKNITALVNKHCTGPEEEERAWAYLWFYSRHDGEMNMENVLFSDLGLNTTS